MTRAFREQKSDQQNSDSTLALNPRREFLISLARWILQTDLLEDSLNASDITKCADQKGLECPSRRSLCRCLGLLLGDELELSVDLRGSCANTGLQVFRVLTAVVFQSFGKCSVLHCE